MFVAKIVNWLTLRDYDAEVDAAHAAVVSRFARGNVTFQNGEIMDEAGLDLVRAAGDVALRELLQQLSAMDANGTNNTTQRNIGRDPRRMGQG